MPISSLRLAVPLASLAVFSACSPSAIPAGYTYHRETYKSPPAPKADEIGYDFSVAANHKAVSIWDEIASDALARLESGYTFQSRDVAVIPPLGIDHTNRSLDYALHRAFRQKGYTLQSYSPDLTSVVVSIQSLGGQSKDYGLESRGDFALRHGLKESEIKTVQISLDVREGAALAHQLSGAYHIPAFASDPVYDDFGSFERKRTAGEAPYRTEPENRPVAARPGSVSVSAPAPAGGDKTAGAPTSILKNELEAPAVKDEANAPLDVQDEGFND